MNDASVAVTGIGLITALGAGREENLRAALSGASGLGPIRAFDASPYACGTGGEIRDGGSLNAARRALTAANGRVPDRPSCILAAALWEALRDSGLDRDATALREAPLFLGNTLGGMEQGTRFYRGMRNGSGAARSTHLEEEGLPDLSLFLAHAQAGLVASAAGIGGPLRIVSNACASASTAILLGADAVRSGSARIAITGGFEPFCEFTHAGFSSLQAVTRDAVRPFDRRRSGMVLGEGAGILVLERLGAARARGAPGRALLAGGGEVADPHHLTRIDPEGRGLAEAVRMALRQADQEPEDVGGIVAHATATPVNDPAEIAALRSVMKGALSRIRVTAFKPYWGHLLGAAGGAEAALAVLSLDAGSVPAILNLREPDPACDGPDFAMGAPAALKRPSVLVNALGFGGLNTSLLFMRPE